MSLYNREVSCTAENVVVVNKGYQGCHSITETSPVQTELWLWLGI